VKFENGKSNLKGRLLFSLMDISTTTIIVNLWGDYSNLPLCEGDIIAINGARVSNFGGKSLNCAIDHAKIFVNPHK
jgi:hypothetical protein